MAAALSDADLLGRLVGFDTVSYKSNLPLVGFLAEYAGPGVPVERHPSTDGEKASLILRFGPEARDRSGLVLSAHMDVVPAEEEAWEGDPFTLRDKGLTKLRVTLQGVSAGWLARAGMECVIFGPGSITEAHKPNEFVSKSDLARARTYLEQAVERLACR